MFIGKYYHKLEEKGRVSLPKRFREQESNWIVTRGLDGGLFIFAQTEFVQQMQSIATGMSAKKTNRDFVRLMANDAHETTADKNGRIQLPDHLITTAGLKNNVVLVGSLSKIEIWDQETYHDYIDSIEDQAEAITEQIAQN